MNRLAAILPAGDVLVDVDATSKKRVFEQAGLLFENQHAIARATVTDNLFARERLAPPVSATAWPFRTAGSRA
jgi:PTS system nitrogen regulatory IIA component